MNKKFTCTIIGSLGRNRAVADGQTIKTKILYEEILAERLYDEVNIVDMSDRKGRGFSIFLQIIYAFFWSDHIIFSVSSNGMRVLYPMLYYMNHIFKKAIIQVTIGGGLPKRTQKNPKLIKYMNSFGKNFVETEKSYSNLIPGIRFSKCIKTRLVLAYAGANLLTISSTPRIFIALRML
jgi:hypothetical protein